MAYDRLNLKAFEDTWKAEHVEHIEDAIERLYNDLYDDKSSNAKFTEYFNTWDRAGGIFTATFAGWTGYIGTVKNISHVKIRFKAIKNYPISMVCIKFWELPDKSSLTPNANGVGYTPDINSWNCISATSESFDVVTETSIYTEKFIELEVPIVNNEKQLVMGIDFNNVVSVPKTNLKIDEWFPDDRPPFGVVTSSTRTPDYENLTEESIKTAVWVQTSGNLDATAFNFENPTTVVSPICVLYNEEGGDLYTEIGTQDKDKFSNLVKDVLNNSGIQTNIDNAATMVMSNFEPGIEKTYYKGSQNLDRTQTVKNGVMSDQTSGYFWGIGQVASDIMIAGFKTAIKTRIKDDYTKCTKAWGYLYESDANPDASPQSADRPIVGDNTNLVRIVELDVNLNVLSEEGAIVEFIFDSPYYNVDKKQLYIGYNLDVPAYPMSCGTYTQAWDVLKTIDGGTYGTCYYYTTINKQKLDVSKKWELAYTIASMQPWHLIKGRDRWYPAEGLKELIKEASDSLVVAPTAQVCLPKQYDLVVGDTFQMFYRGVIKCFDINAQGINVLCKIGNAYPRYFECTPTVAGTYPLKLQCRDIAGNIIASGETTLVVHDLPTYTANKNVTMMIFGDSLTEPGTWVAEGIRRVVGTDQSVLPTSLQIPNLSINTYGAKSCTRNGHTVYHEGYGGWGWTSFMATEQVKSTVNGIFITLSSSHNYNLNSVQKSVWVDNNGKKWELENLVSDKIIKFNRGDKNNDTQANTSLPTQLSCSSLNLTLSNFTSEWESGNPFYDTSNSKVDFAHHANKYGYESADIAACLLSWNLGGGTGDGLFEFTERIDVIIEEQAKPLIRQLHNDMPNAKLIVMGLQLNSITGGMAANYGASGGYADAWGAMMFAFDYDKALEDMCNDAEFNSFCYYVDTKGQFDTEYMMPWEEKSVNIRLSDVKEIRGTNGVHPSGAGYLQIGDAFFRKLIGVLNDLNN